MGIPTGAVLQKMRQDGALSEEEKLVFEAATGGGGGGGGALHPPAPAPAPAPTSMPAAPPVHTLPEYRKYAKMKAVGLPLSAIAHKMAGDGIGAAEVRGTLMTALQHPLTALRRHRLRRRSRPSFHRQRGGRRRRPRAAAAAPAGAVGTDARQRCL
jgi:hypothetical protein